MALNFDELVVAINGVVWRYPSTQLGDWYIGITNKPERRKDEREREGLNTKAWHWWTAIDEDTAIRVEKYFLKRGMKGGPGEDEDTIQNKVYIF